MNDVTHQYRRPGMPGGRFVVLMALALFFVSAPVCLVPRRCEAATGFLSLVRDRIEHRVQGGLGKQDFLCHGERICGLRIMPEFYGDRDYEPAWFDGGGLRPTVEWLVRYIGQTDKEGLNPADYHLAAIERLVNDLSAQPFPPEESRAAQWADLDLILTDAFLLLGSHLSGGRINPETLHTDWLIQENSIDMLAFLHTTETRVQMERALREMAPVHAGYQGLKTALQRMRDLERRGGWPQIQIPQAIKPGEKSDRVAAVRRRMQISEDLPVVESMDRQSEPSDIYEDALVSAVQRFQKRHGLAADGIIGRRTREALNVTAAQRVRQIELNLERWRWLPRHLGERYIEVNTADFSLCVMDGSHKVLGMRVVVGRPARRTPVFSTVMSYMVLNPYWNVPRTIAVKDILPKLADGADYLQKEGFKVFAGWQEDAPEVDPRTIPWKDYNEDYFPLMLRQEPGKNNALGQIKFIFPNKFAVYLHDTPQRSLFERVQRDFSSGCIRLEKAPALANYLLADDPFWTADRLLKVFQRGQRRVVRIPRPIAVHLLYMTAWVDENGALQFRKDIYGRDRKLSAALFERRPYALPAGSASGSAQK
jgi:murein L,D-transpeptidase YcbB/YkuD